MALSQQYSIYKSQSRGRFPASNSNLKCTTQKYSSCPVVYYMTIDFFLHAWKHEPKSIALRDLLWQSPLWINTQTPDKTNKPTTQLSQRTSGRSQA
jgi:hypothetical protein